jgi:eukaryotic-like serine/threonine-protein kinase
VRLRQKLGIAELSPTETLAVKQTLPTDPDAARFYAEGLGKLRAFDALGARDLLQKAITLEPDFSLAHSALAEAWSVLGFDHNAAQEAATAFKFSSKLPRREQIAVEGRYRMSTKNWNEAVGLYQTLFGLFPDDLEYGLLLASAQIAASHPRDGLTTVSLLRRLPPPAGTDPRLHLKEYEAWKSLGDFERMETALSQASEQAGQQGALLLVARAQTRLCWVRRILAKQPQAVDDCQQARKIYAAAGDRRGEAETLRFLGDVEAESDIPAAIDDYNRSVALEREIGHVGGVAAVSNQLATQYAKQGDHASAEKTYERTLAAFRELGDTLNATGVLINVADELAAQGQIDRANQVYRNALEGAAALDNKYIEGLAEYNIGLLQQSRGDLEAARSSFQQALTWFREVNDREFDIAALRGLGEVATSRGDLAGARSLYEQALATQQASEYKDAAAQTRIDVALLSMEEGSCSADVESSLRQIFERFQSRHSINDEALSSAALARCLQIENQMDAALDMARRADELSAKAEPSIRLEAQIMAARVRAAAEPGKGQQQSLNELRAVITEARRLRFLGAELDATAAIGDIEIHSGDPARGRNRLQTVEREASRNGFVLIARKAK